MFYEANKSEAPEEYAQVFEEVEAAAVKISELQEEIASLKGGKACPKCGAIVSSAASFCSECGTKLNDIFEED